MRPLLELHILEFDAQVGMTPRSLLTTGYCRGACAGLLRVLAVVDPAGMWRIVGGCGAECSPLPTASLRLVNTNAFPGGIRSVDGYWAGHFWLEGVCDCGPSVIADLTADQFGHAKVVIAETDDHRYRKNILSVYDPLTSAERRWGSDLARRLLGDAMREHYDVAA
jgi:hypothetical protein